jgi:hypothetical protein
MRMRWVQHIACMGGKTGVYRVLVERPEGKKTDDLGIHGRI